MSDKYVSKLKLKDNTTVTIKDENAYTKEQVDKLISDNLSKKLSFKTVAELPEIATADPRTIYFVSRNSPYEDDMYDEYVLLGDKWEFLGNKDLTAYAKIGLLNEYLFDEEHDINNAIFNDNVDNGNIKFDLDDQVLIRHSGNQVYSTTVRNFTKLITNNVYLKDSILPISSRALNNYIKSKEIKIQLKNTSSTDLFPTAINQKFTTYTEKLSELLKNEYDKFDISKINLLSVNVSLNCNPEAYQLIAYANETRNSNNDLEEITLVVDFYSCKANQSIVTPIANYYGNLKIVYIDNH